MVFLKRYKKVIFRPEQNPARGLKIISSGLILQINTPFKSVSPLDGQKIR
jgi:hypothetical protein